MQGNKAVPNLCQGRATLPQGERAWNRAELLTPRWAGDRARGVGWGGRAEGPGGHAGVGGQQPLSHPPQLQPSCEVSTGRPSGPPLGTEAAAPWGFPRSPEGPMSTELKIWASSSLEEPSRSTSVQPGNQRGKQRCRCEGQSRQEERETSRLAPGWLLSLR